jgi:hypothetical protein
MALTRIRTLLGRLLGATFTAFALFLALGAGSAVAATAPPTLLAPAGSTTHGTPLSVEYELPEAGSTGLITFAPSSGPAVTVTLTPAALAEGKHHFFLDLHALASESANVKEATASSLADGEYIVALSYSNLAKEPLATATALKVTIKSVTGVPSLTEPKAKQSFREPFKVAYTLPEAALPGSVTLRLVGAHTEAKTLTLSNSAAGSHTAEILPAHPSLGAGVASGPTAKLPADTYTIVLAYQDALGDPAASASVTEVTIGYALCNPGTYGSGGELPCTSAPRGYHVESSGSSAPTECAAGRFAAEEGTVFCPAAEPGHYVPASGAKAQLECEAGTYQDEAGQTGCKAVGAGHYAGKGSAFAVACAAGTHNPHLNAPSAEYCDADAPGSYSAEGAAEATLCAPGRFAASAHSQTCLLADPGHFAAGEGATSERACPAGTFASATGSAACIETPEGTYATGGAVEATPCPAGSTSRRGASACIVLTAAVGIPQGVKTGGSSPSPTGTTAVSHVSAKVAPGRRTKSLALSRQQRVIVTCSAAATVKLRVSATLKAGGKHLTLTGSAVAVDCLAGRAREVVVAFKVGAAAERLLSKHGASVTLAVRAYLTGASAGTLVGSGSLRGRP